MIVLMQNPARGHFLHILPPISDTFLSISLYNNAKINIKKEKEGWISVLTITSHIVSEHLNGMDVEWGWLGTDGRGVWLSGTN